MRCSSKILSSLQIVQAQCKSTAVLAGHLLDQQWHLLSSHKPRLMLAVHRHSSNCTPKHAFAGPLENCHEPQARVALPGWTEQKMAVLWRKASTVELGSFRIHGDSCSNPNFPEAHPCSASATHALPCLQAHTEAFGPQEAVLSELPLL